MNVDRLALDRPLVAEHFHAVDELHDAVGFVANEPRQRAVVVVDRLLQELRRAADAGQRIFDFVRQHGGECDHRARRAAMGQLTIHLVGDGALLQHHHHVVELLRQRRHVQVDEPVAGIARRSQIDLVFVDCGAARAHLLDQGEQGTAERHQVAQGLTPQQRQRNFEERFRRRIGIDHLAVRRHDDDGMRQRVEHRICGRDHQQRLGRTHARRPRVRAARSRQGRKNPLMAGNLGSSQVRLGQQRCGDNSICTGNRRRFLLCI